jgi:hypothetical protein
MNTVILEVRSLADTLSDAARAMNVHGDVVALLNAGVLSRAAEGGVVFPFDAVKVEFLLEAS